MWPLLLDMTKEESINCLRNLELEAYSNLVSALRAQGPLSSDKRKILKDTGTLLNISQERHKAEVRRAINDERLNTIAYHITGHLASSEDWAQEGQRLIPLLPRTAPQTAFSAIADEVAESAIQSNKQLPLPSNTERKRHAPQMNSVMQENKGIPFRVPEPPKIEENKKRKLQLNPENSSLAQHLLSPKFSKIQQLYRQRSKPKVKEVHRKIEHEQMEALQQHNRMIPPIYTSNVPPPSTVQIQQQQNQHPNQKVQVLQNISLQSIKEESVEQSEEQLNEQVPNVPICTNENHVPRPKLITTPKQNSGIAIKPSTPQVPGPSAENQKIKITSAKKSITKTVSSGQKLIVVSNAQTITSNSILQRTLQIPFVKNLSIKNFDKFKIVTTNSSPTSIQVASVTNSSGNPVKHKVVTVKTNPITKKVIPLSQLQVLNSKGNIKVLPLGGKIVGKTMASNSSTPLYIMNASQLTSKTNNTTPLNIPNKVIPTEEIKPVMLECNETIQNVPAEDDGNKEPNKSSVLADILKASGVAAEQEDYDSKIEEFHIPQSKIKNDEYDKDETVETLGNQKEYVERMELHDNVGKTVEYEIIDINKEEMDELEKNESQENYTIINKEVIEAENDLSDMRAHDQEMIHVEEIIDHQDFNEVTINTEEDIMLQVNCSTDLADN